MPKYDQELFVGCFVTILFFQLSVMLIPKMHYALCSLFSYFQVVEIRIYYRNRDGYQQTHDVPS